MHHDPVKKNEQSHESSDLESSAGRTPGSTPEQGAAGVPLYLQRQPLGEEEDELQAKLQVGAPNDKYEQQADQIADQVMRMPDAALQRQPLEEEEEMLQTKPLAESITPLAR